MCVHADYLMQTVFVAHFEDYMCFDNEFLAEREKDSHTEK